MTRPAPIPPDIDWSGPRAGRPRKEIISLRLDPDILAFFKSQGPGYQTRINAVLRTYMEAVQNAPRD